MNPQSAQIIDAKPLDIFPVKFDEISSHSPSYLL